MKPKGFSVISRKPWCTPCAGTASSRCETTDTTNCRKDRSGERTEARSCDECIFVGYVRQFAAQRLRGICYAPQARNEGCPPCEYGLWFICAAYWLVRIGRSRDISRFLTCGAVIGRAAAIWASLRAAGAERAWPAMRIWPPSHVSRLADRSHDLSALCIMCIMQMTWRQKC